MQTGQFQEGESHFLKNTLMVVLNNKGISNNFQNYEQTARVILEL